MKVAVMSNKGGVGKTTVSVLLARELARRGKRVALVDLDFHGPTLPVIAGIKAKAEITSECIKPVKVNDNLEVVSILFLLSHDDDPVLWPGDIKRDMVLQIVGGKSVCWSEYDIMIVDSPPSLGDENLTLLTLVDKVVLVTTPHPAAVHDIRSMIKALEKVKRHVIALVVNMYGAFNGEVPKVDKIPTIIIPFDTKLQNLSSTDESIEPIKHLADIVLGG
jgi:Mrp family chromosome partitioning ATPase